MKRIILLALLSGCATTPAPNPWDGVAIDETAPESPQPLPSWPEPVEFSADNVVFDLAGARDLEAYRAASEANETIAAEHAGQIIELKTATEQLLAAGQAQRALADMRADMLADERRHAIYTSLGYWVIILAMGLAL